MLQTFPIAQAGVPAPDANGLPPGLGGGTPVARTPGQVASLGQDALRLALRPMVPLLQEIHDTVATVRDRPQEIAVEFGVRVGNNLKLGIVGGSADATLKVTATWKLPPSGPQQTS